MWNIDPTQIQEMLHLHRHIYRICIQKWDCETKGGRKAGKKDGEKVHHICVGTRHKEIQDRGKRVRMCSGGVTVT
jgi:hypothetical protein